MSKITHLVVNFKMSKIMHFETQICERKVVSLTPVLAKFSPIAESMVETAVWVDRMASYTEGSSLSIHVSPLTCRTPSLHSARLVTVKPGALHRVIRVRVVRFRGIRVIRGSEWG